jgi:hypothetical protein
VTARLDGKGKFGIWVTPVQESRKWPFVGWLYEGGQGRAREELTFDTVAEAKAWLVAAVTWWETKYEIKEYVP